jgi:hypothetical protein
MVIYGCWYTCSSVSPLVVMVVHEDEGPVGQAHAPVRDVQVEECAPVLIRCLRHLLTEPEWGEKK